MGKHRLTPLVEKIGRKLIRGGVYILLLQRNVDWRANNTGKQTSRETSYKKSVREREEV